LEGGKNKNGYKTEMERFYFREDVLKISSTPERNNDKCRLKGKNNKMERNQGGNLINERRRKVRKKTELKGILSGY
jgi:hypothetical protein